MAARESRRPLPPDGNSFAAYPSATASADIAAGKAARHRAHVTRSTCHSALDSGTFRQVRGLLITVPRARAGANCRSRKMRWQPAAVKAPTPGLFRAEPNGRVAAPCGLRWIAGLRRAHGA